MDPVIREIMLATTTSSLLVTLFALAPPVFEPVLPCMRIFALQISPVPV